MKRKGVLCAALFLMFLWSCTLPSSQGGDIAEDDQAFRLVVPEGSPVELDGSLSPGEWDDAQSDALSDGSQIFLMHSGEDVYLGIRAVFPEMFVTNVFVLQDEQVAVMHSSAALGTATYLQDEEGWQCTKGFEWRCRSTGDGASARSEREAFLSDEGWLANNSWMGIPNEVEFQLKITDFPVKLAVQLIPTHALDERIYWPILLGDDITMPYSGGLPNILNLDPDQWAILDIFE